MRETGREKCERPCLATYSSSHIQASLTELVQFGKETITQELE